MTDLLIPILFLLTGILGACLQVDQLIRHDGYRFHALFLVGSIVLAVVGAVLIFLIWRL